MCFVVPEQVRGTYRIQLRPEFGFRDAAALSGYLRDLGISHLYCSPVLQAASGSEHGYDVVDPGRVSDDLGGPEGHRELTDALARDGLGQVLDIVPNHMAITDPKNAWWWDVLENGPSSPYARFFDVDWPDDPPTPAATGVAERPAAVLLPVLPTHYGRVLEEGGIRVGREGERFQVHVADRVLPSSPRSVGFLLRRACSLFGSEADTAGLGAEAALAFVADSLEGLPSPMSTDREATSRRRRDLSVLMDLLRRLLSEDAGAARAVDRAVDELNEDPERLDRFLSHQNYRLGWWRLAGEELGYRRFFHINELVALRTEDPDVFSAVHERVLAWLREGVVDGVRVDHPDGLRDPQGYFARLRDAASNAWILAEKILEPCESLRESWDIDGTTGYDFLNRAGGLFVDPDGEDPFIRIYGQIVGGLTDFEAILYECRLRACTELLGSDLNRMTDLFRAVCERHPRHRDHPLSDLREALAEVAAAFPVYRTYVRAEEGEISAEDREIVGRAVAGAKARRPDLDPDPLSFLEDLLLLRVRGALESELVMRFQQFTGPVAAKGVEDTAFYRYNRFVALNEVGGDPSRFGTPVGDFHRESARVQERWPRTLLSGSTHDTKRSEDVRARLYLLSEIPDQWEAAVERWRSRTARHRTGGVPGGNLEYLCYQTLVGAWPVDGERLTAYLEKAAREAGVRTTWTAPDEQYEQGVRRFAFAILEDREFVEDLEDFVRPLVEPGRVNSLSQTLLRLTSPGVPDVYQGCELWDLSLVDPDNRRPVDFPLRRRLLAELPELSPEAVLARSDQGLPKLHLLQTVLAARRERPELFGAEGGYRPLSAEGSAAKHVVAFVRGEGAVTVVPRLILGLDGRWGDTVLELPPGSWTDRLTGARHRGGRIRMVDLLERFPVSLLVREDEE